MNRYIIVFATIACVNLVSESRAEGQATAADSQAMAREHARRADLYQARGQNQQAADQYLKAYELVPKPFLLFNAAQMYWRDEKRMQALDLYHRYLTEETEGGGIEVAQARFFEVAEIYWAEGRKQKALLYYGEYLRLAPRGKQRDVAQERFYVVADEYLGKGETETAVTYFKRYAELAPRGVHADRVRDRLEQLEREIMDARRAREAAERQRERERLASVEQQIDDEAPGSGRTDKLGLSDRLAHDGSSSARTLRRIGGLGMAVGVGALCLGVFHGLNASSISDDLSSRTESWEHDDRVLVAEGEQAQRDMKMAYGIGAAALVSGGLLYYLGRRRDQTRRRRQIVWHPRVSDTAASVVVSMPF